jgi:hypothetical protein
VVVGAALAGIGCAALAGGGCAQLAGIDDTNGRGRIVNSVAVTQMSIGNAVTLAPLELTGLSATYLVPSAANAAGFDRVLAGDVGKGTWSADLAEPTPVEFTLPAQPAPSPQLFAFPNRELAVLYAVLEHPHPTAPPDGAMLTVTTTLDAAVTASDSFRIFTVGAWSRHDLVGAEIPAVGAGQLGPFTYAYASSSSQSGRPTLDRLTMDDAFLVLRYVGNALTGVAEAAPFNQTGADTVTATMAPVAQDQTFELKIDPPKLATRYTAVRPAVSGLVMSWSAVAAPGARIAQNSGPLLNAAGVAPADVTIPVKYGNPFLGHHWSTIFTLGTYESRVYTPAGAMAPVTLYAGLNQFIEPSAGFDLTLPAGLPEAISLDNKPLSNDGQTIAPPTKLVEVSFISDNANATVFGAQLFDLVPNTAGTAIEERLVFSASSNQARFSLPPELFHAGHSYMIRAMCTYGGYPAIGNGDFVTRELPLAQGYLDSAVFTVTPAVTP